MTDEPTTEKPVTDEPVTDDGAGAEPASAALKSRRIDPVSVVAGLLFIAIAAATLTDRFWAEIDPVLVLGGAIVAVGLAMITGVVLRRRREREPVDA